MTKDNLISTKDAADIIGKSSETIRSWIKSEKIKGIEIDGQYFVYKSDPRIQREQQDSQNEATIGHIDETSIVNLLKEQIEDSKEREKGWQTQLSEKDKQIDELLKQQDQSQQIIAMQQKNLDRLTEQNQLLLEASQDKEEKKVGFWGRLIGQRA